MAPSRKLAELFYELRAKTEGLKKDTDEAERHLGKLSTFVLRNPVAALTALGAAALGVAAKAAIMAEKVEGSLKRVSAAVPTGTQGLDVLRKKIADISKETGRTQEELSRAAETAATVGAESAEGVAKRLEAVSQTADATGDDLNALFGGLDQVLDLFGKSSEDAQAALAELFAAARGRTSLTELFASFQAAAPAIEQLQLDLNTSARALVALGEQGKSAKQAASALKAFAGAGAEGRAAVLKLAESIPRAANPMSDLAAAADLANSSGDRLAARLREQLNAELIELGTHILPIAIGALQDLLRLFGSGKADNLFKNNLAVVLAFGNEIASARTKTDVLNTSFKEQEHALRSMADAVRDGEVSLRELSRIQLTDLQRTLVGIANQPLVTEETRAGVRELLKQIETLKLAALNAPAPTIAPAVKRGDEITADKKSAEAARERAEAIRDLNQSLGDLIEHANAGELSLADFDRRLREINDTASDRKLRLTKNEIEAIAIAAEAAREQLQQTKAGDVAREFAKLRASLTTDALDDFAVALDDLKESMREKGFTSEQRDEIVRLFTAVRDAQKLIADTGKEIDAIASAGLPPLRQASALQARRVELEQELTNLVATGGKNSERKLAIEGAIQKIDEAIASLSGSIADDTGRAAANAIDFAQTLENGASAAFGIASALLGADSSVTRMLGGVQQIASGFQQIAALAKEAGGFAALFAKSGGIASALPGLGAILGGLAGVVSLVGKGGGISPEEQRRQQEHAENVKLLERIRDGIVDLAGAPATSGEVERVRSALRTATSAATLRDVFPRGLSITDTEQDKALRTLGTSLSELRRVAAAYNIELDGTFEAYQDLLRVLEEVNTAVKKNAELQSVTSIREEFGVIDAKQAAAEAIRNFRTAFGESFAGIDLSSLDFSSLDAFKSSLKPLVEAFGADGIISDSEQAILDAVRGILDRWGAITPEVKSAADKFTDAMELLGVTFEFSGADAAERLAKITDKFRELFPDLASSIDFSSAEAFDASLQRIIDGFAADGLLSDAEKEQIAVLRALRDAFKAAQPAAEEFISALDALADHFDIFASDAADRFRLLGIALGDAFPDVKELLAGIDPTSAEGRAELEKRARALLTKLAEGGITKEEQTIVDAIRRILGASRDLATEQAQAAEQVARDSAERRAQILRDAEDLIAGADISDPLEQLRVRLEALKKAVPGLTDVFDQFDLSTEAGREALDAFIGDLFQHPEKLEALAKQFGIPIDELKTLLLGLEGGFDALGAHILTLSDEIQAALSQLSFELDLAGITEPLEVLKRTAEAIGKIDPRIAEALKGIDLTTPEGQAKAISELQKLGTGSTDKDLQAEILKILALIRGLPVPGVPGDGTSAVAAGGGGRTSVESAVLVTEVTANRMVDFLGQIAANTRDTLSALLGRVQPLSLPSIANVGTGGQTFNTAGGVNVNLGGVSFPLELAAGATLDFETFRAMMERNGLPWLKDQLARDLASALAFQGQTRIS